MYNYIYLIKNIKISKFDSDKLNSYEIIEELEIIGIKWFA